MGSKMQKSQGRGTETKVKNRSKIKVFTIPTLNASKALKVFEEYKKNGLNYGNFEDLCKESNSLRSFRRNVGKLMEMRSLGEI